MTPEEHLKYLIRIKEKAENDKLIKGKIKEAHMTACLTC